MENFKVTVNGVTEEYPCDMTYAELAEKQPDGHAGEVILAMHNGNLVELSKKLKGNGNVGFVTTSDVPGHETYVRGCVMLMLCAFSKVYGSEVVKDITVDHSIGDAIYCSFNSETGLSEEKLDEVLQKMRHMVEKDVPFTKRSVNTTEARELFKNSGMPAKAKLLRFRCVSNTNIYNLDGFVTYNYGYMPKSCKVLKAFGLRLYKDGFLLLLPSRKNPGVVADFKERPKLFATQHAANLWGKYIGIETVGDLNEAICSGNISDLILVQEAHQERIIGEIAESIKKSGNKKFIMIAGPSSSGKTTFSHRLSIQLRTLGYRPHPIALDNYFVNREDTPKDEFGNYNFECLEAIDVEGFNHDMVDLLSGKEVSMRTFNFKTGKREYKGDKLRLGEEDILVIEGIHGLNDRLSYMLPKESKYKIYISALTQLNIDEHTRMKTTDGRLIRRMVRDARTRGTAAKDTLAMWASVRRGEEENIFPFQEEADYMFNSSLVYELAVLKQYAEPLLFGIPEDSAEYIEAKRLLKMLDYFLGVSSEEIPHNSVVREFVGGSVFPV